MRITIVILIIAAASTLAVFDKPKCRSSTDLFQRMNGAHTCKQEVV